jgi:hypothetical protein
MTVAKQNYTVSPTWTAAQVADALGDALTDAGLMTSWWSSFSNGGFENRVLQVVYDGTKNLGTCYYWFIISSTFFGVSIATGWNSNGNAPVGTARLDFVTSSTNITTGHCQIGANLVTGTDVTITRYTSGLDSSYSWFVFRNGSTPFPFMIAPASVEVVPWIDKDKLFFHHFLFPSLNVQSSTSATSIATASFESACRIRSSYLEQGALRGSTTNSRFITKEKIFSYRVNSHANNTANNDSILSVSSVVHPPYGISLSNTYFASDYTPILKGCSYSLYVKDSLPLDMGITFSYLTTAFSFGSRLVVSSGVEEWEVIDFANNDTSTASSPLLLMRDV